MEVKIAKYELSLGIFLTNPKRVKALFKKIVGDKNVVIYGNIATGKKELAQALSDVQIEWDSGKEPMLKFKQMLKHIHMIEKYDFIEINTGEKMISQIERVGWFNSLIKPPFVVIPL